MDERQRRPIIDIADVLVFGGILMVGCGIWMVRPWVAFVVVGAAMFGLGIWSSVPRRG